MSTPTYSEGQEISFGLLSDIGQEEGFLHGARVRIVEARYGKGKDIPLQYLNLKEGEAPPEPRIAAKFKLAIQKNDGTEKILDNPQEYSTGLIFGGDKAYATISPDGKRLIAKKGFTGFGKKTDFYHLWESSVNAGLPEDVFKGDLSVYDNLVFQVVSEKNPRLDATKAKPKPFFGLLLTGGATTPGPQATNAPTTASVPASSLSAEVLGLGASTLQTIVANSGGSVTRKDIPSLVQPIANEQKWDVATRTQVMQALFEVSKLSAVAASAGLKLTGETVSF